MKRTRRFLVMILCTFALLGTVGCGNNSADNAADQTMQDKNGTNRKENGNVNDATAGNGNGVMDDAVDDVTERFTTGKMECKKEKTHVLHKLNISEILHFTRRCYDETCKNEM